VCAHAVRVAFKNIQGVDRVDVSLNQGKATVDLKPGNTVTIAQLENALVKNGFTTKESQVVVAGTLILAGGKWSLRVSGSKEEFALMPDASAQMPSADGAGKSAVVTGKMMVTDMKKPPAEIRFSSITEEK
jgi:copper chaperone CopZ